MNNIYYLGPKGSYSYRIAQKLFGEKDLKSCPSFAEVVQKTKLEPGATGILPIENSVTSNIHENMDYLFREKLNVTGEAFLKIRVDLIGLIEAEKKDVKKVYSHQQALSQCREYIKKHNLTIQETSSTSAARSLVLKIDDKRVGLLGGSDLADGVKLKILEQNIADEKDNITRFLFVSGGNQSKNGIRFNKASVVFTIPHKPGSLALLLAELAKSNLNLTKIESRPIPATDWEYRFWIDIERTADEEIDERSLNDILKRCARSYKIIGMYKSGKIYE